LDPNRHQVFQGICFAIERRHIWYFEVLWYWGFPEFFDEWLRFEDVFFFFLLYVLGFLLDASHPVFQLLIGFLEFFNCGFQIIVHVVLTT
jgi:hypothetical protein